jgi:hypothetical protein
MVFIIYLFIYLYHQQHFSFFCFAKTKIIEFSESELYDLVRFCAGDLVEFVQQVYTINIILSKR